MKNYNKIFDEPKRETVLDGLNPQVIVDDEKISEIDEIKKEFDAPKTNRIKKIVNYVAVNVRSEPSLKSKVLTVLKIDDDIHAEELENKEWYYVITKSGIKGYVMSKYIG